MISPAHFYFLFVPMILGLQVGVARHLVSPGILGLDFPLTGFLTASSFRR